MAFTRSPAAYLALPVMFFLFLSFSSFQDSFDDIELTEKLFIFLRRQPCPQGVISRADLSGTRAKLVGKKAVEHMLDPKRIKVVHRKFTRPTVGAGKPTYPTTERELGAIGFYFDRGDHTREIADTRPTAKPGDTRTANIFHWQAASQAKSLSNQSWI
ncbi:hypothetical protein BO79DRAFT_217747 [Aspergillus costaricaensis CBS 115574]|uniref:Uncharacterized protein n=1 Tax=Aspergillus costaricaensis CBS 115574 TaxID=1448317 RepID=A0ACD1IFG4_9EURO|nr:hypothetical protein BO79DRAFT_217747 [Aspergillus costaricaensis CBS 115574]RAK89041.1 hypothetical protein BO79DRAFT_217747 [Aspergillus costaricaensis CBS 115574]